MSRTNKRNDTEQKEKNLDEIIKEIEEIIDQMNNDELSLEEAFERFKHGMMLLKAGMKRLSEIEEQTKILIEDVEKDFEIEI